MTASVVPSGSLVRIVSGPELALVERVELGLEVVDDRGDVLLPVLVDQRLGGDLGDLLRRRSLPASGLGFLTRARTNWSAAWKEIAVPPPPSTRVRSRRTERLLETLANVVVGLGPEHVGDPAPVLRVEHLETARQFAVAFQPTLHRGLVRVVEEFRVGEEPEMTDLTARRVEEVVTRLAGERSVVVDQRRQADGVVGIELPPPAGLNFALARLLAKARRTRIDFNSREVIALKSSSEESLASSPWAMTTISADRSRSLRQRSACSTSVEKTSSTNPAPFAAAWPPSRR